MNNVMPIKSEKLKSDRYSVYTAEVDANNQVIEQAKVGFAFIRPEGKVFRLKLWMFDKVQYFISPVQDDNIRYDVLCLEEYLLSNGEVKTNWNKVGDGIYFGNYIKLSFHLLNTDIFVSLFPSHATNDDQKCEAA
jgi:hypothetical protein